MLRKSSQITLVLTIVVMAIAVIPLTAAVKATNLKEQVTVCSGVLYGKVIAKEAQRFDFAGRKDVTFTKLTVQGEDLTTGKKETREIYYMGGNWDGQLDTTCVSPKEHQTRLGATVVVFYWFSEDITPPGAPQGVFKVSSFASIFQVQQGAGSATVIGLGEGCAIPKSRKINDLRTEVQQIYQQLQAEKKNGI